MSYCARCFKAVGRLALCIAPVVNCIFVALFAPALCHS